jgi:hypothetical protein
MAIDDPGEPGVKSVEDGKGPLSADEDKTPKQKHHTQLILVAVGIAGVIVTWLIYRSRSSTSSTTATTTTPTNTTGTVAGASGSGSDPYADALAGQNQQAISGLSQLITSLQSEVSTMQASPAPAPAPAAAAPTPTTSSNGFGQTTIGGKVFDILGNVTNGLFNGFNVGGGEPVYYNTPAGLETNISPTQISALAPGTQVLTIAQAGQQGQIGATPVSAEHIGA